MSDSEAEKTEAPTPKKRQDARDEGQVPRSQELTTAVLLLGSALALQQFAPALGRAMMEVFGTGLMASGTEMDAASAAQLLQTVGWKVLVALLALLLTMMGLAVAIGVAQTRGMFSAKAAAPKWGKLNPLENGKRMLGTQPWVDLVKSLAKLAIIGLAVYGSLKAAWPDVLALAQQSPVALLYVVQKYGVKLLVTAGASYLALAGADYAWQLWQHEKQLRMSKEEVKQEHKQSEGDPMVKARMRSAGRALVRKQMMRDVPKADVVLVNPVHIAVALRYDPSVAPAPFVVALGKRKVAERIKEIAAESGVPIVENIPLARALVAGAKLGQMIPAELYAAVAEILAFVLRQRAMASSRWQGSAVA